ncbi:MAG: hypothetical protein KatS3mg076_0501 [Candidatus Binatia bacterium]|nr:MAG: hypothetical protein KatS3mg076_0501 [Candidatus Binatia bacterium]
MTGDVFDERYFRERGDRIALWYYARVVRHLAPRGGKLLDFGCGTGHFLRRLEPHFETYAFDPSPAARAETRKNASETTLLDDWRELPPAFLDVVTALHSLEHLSEPGEVLGGLAARLRPGGLFFAVVPNPEGLGARLKGDRWFGFRDPTHLQLLPRAQWEELFRLAGLAVRRVRGDGMWDAPYVRGLPVFFQKLVFGLPAGLQVFSPFPRLFLPPLLGECLVIEARREADPSAESSRAPEPHA